MPAPDHAAAVNQLADRFWEAILEELPITATLYGDDRYDDRLPDISATGRARARSHRQATLAELAAIPVEGLPTEERITHDMLRVVCELGIRADDLRMDVIASVDQMDGPQTLLSQVVQVQRADTPERLEKLLARYAGLPAFVDASIDILAEGRADGSTAARLVADRVVAQSERLLATPAAESALVRVPRLAERCRDDGARAPRGRRRARRPAGARPLPGGGPRPVPRRDARGAGPLVRPTRRGALPDGHPPVDDPGPRSGGGPRHRPRRARVDPGRAANDRPGRRVRRRHRRLPSRAPRRPGEPRGDQGGARGARHGGHRAGLRPGAARLRAAPARQLRGSPGRGVHGGGRAVRLLLPARRRRLAARHLLRQCRRPAEPVPLEPRHHDLPRGRPGPPFPDRARDGAAVTARLPASRRASRRVLLRRGLGPLLGAPGRRARPVPERGGALRDARRAGLARGAPGRRHRDPRAPQGSRVGRWTSCSGPG